MKKTGDLYYHRFEAATQRRWITQNHAPRPNFAVACENHTDRTVDTGRRGVNGTGSVSDVILLKLNSSESYRLVGAPRTVRLAIRCIHQPH